MFSKKCIITAVDKNDTAAYKIQVLRHPGIGTIVPPFVIWVQFDQKVIQKSKKHNSSTVNNLKPLSVLGSKFTRRTKMYLIFYKTNLILPNFGIMNIRKS